MSYAIWRLRMMLGDALLRLGSWIEPEFRSRHKYSEDGKTITMWREPVR